MPENESVRNPLSIRNFENVSPHQKNSDDYSTPMD